jgi:hypothetical protein
VMAHGLQFGPGRRRAIGGVGQDLEALRFARHELEPGGGPPAESEGVDVVAVIHGSTGGSAEAVAESPVRLPLG